VNTVNAFSYFLSVPNMNTATIKHFVGWTESCKL